ncbi:MAG TPA: gliding motility-associated C-terminal domain-containing protein [Flavobacterium sp.]|jgi:gliding motility-associated-like protein
MADIVYVKPYSLSARQFFFCVLLLLLSQFSFCQLSNFTLSVTPTHETCNANGSLSWTTAGTTPGASMIFKVYELPDVTSELVTLSGNSYGGLSAGNYRVVATQSLGGESASKQQDVTINDMVVFLTYQLAGQAAVCGNNGQITVTVSQGTAVAYEIISGPVIVPLQSSNILTGLSAGVYEVRVFDACGEGVVQTHTLFEGEAGITLNVRNPVAVDCETLQVGLNLSSLNATLIAYPLTFQCTIYPSTGPPIVYNQVITEGSVTNIVYTENIPYTEGDVFSYNIVITDSCGNEYLFNNTVSNFSADPVAAPFNEGCAGGGIVVTNITGLVMVTGPDTYPVALPVDYTSIISPSNTATFSSVPLGTYTFMATDLCGDEVPLSVTVTPPTASAPTVFIFEGCAQGMGSAYMSGDFETVIISAAPAGFPFAVPYDVSQYIDAAHHGFAIGELSSGSYTFEVHDFCGNVFSVSGAVQGYSDNTDVTVFEHCGSFDLQLIHTSTGGPGATFFMQKYDIATGNWVNPMNGNIYIEGTPPTAINSLPILNNVINYNLAYTGSFRILKKYAAFSSGQAVMSDCISTVFEFEFLGGPKIDNIYSFACNGNTFDVIVEATGLAPLIYRITAMNGTPYLIENGNSSHFSGLSPAIYNFQVEDDCGNIVNGLNDISEPYSFTMTGQDFCDGQTGVLSVPEFSFLNYEWWKGNDTGNILSTAGTLNFTPFVASADSGIYHVRIWNPDPNSCLDLTVDYTIVPIPAAQAGTGQQIEWCDRPAATNLFSLLQAPYDSGGAWTNISGMGNLTGNVWDSTGLTAGTYTFKYEVTSVCDSNETVVTIVLLPEPQLPAVNGDINICAGADVELTALSNAGATYHWTGPNNFTSEEQNPVLTDAAADMSGTYTVTASVGNCTSLPAVVEVVVNAAPQFTIQDNCTGSAFTLSAVPLAASVDITGLTFSWSGPGGFSAEGNPVTVTGEQIGDYNLEIITAQGCRSVASTTLAQTLCTIPLGISPNEDGNNDSFDLSGLDVKNLHIFNRYGVTVFEKAVYKNEWRGQDYKDRPLPAGTYYYLVWLASGEAKTGWVYVNREH